MEGLSIGMDVAVRYALDPARIATVARALPEDIEGQVVAPAVQGCSIRLWPATPCEIFPASGRKSRKPSRPGEAHAG